MWLMITKWRGECQTIFPCIFSTLFKTYCSYVVAEGSRNIYEKLIIKWIYTFCFLDSKNVCYEYCQMKKIQECSTYQET